MRVRWEIALEESLESLLRPLGPGLSATGLTCLSDVQFLPGAHPVNLPSNSKAVLSMSSGLSHLPAV